ncbi:AraC family transcriptional regulator [Exilibacterium tricleocarpae]|uniref:AraC family transcriptional regulator n=1 Tax=Exilibacterium tricleocarpae TaxID=2591008 RepID=A0A545SM02_9GAMM|nr:AraC family transcriptional regulator [Exilibacterium tricleocarpae]TQV65999.1 AraC family transcriptional regulator [Exilibacterium tricleocarpae]
MTEKATYRYAAELGGLELLQADYRRQTFSRHSHEGYTIGVIESGAQQFYRTGGNHIAPRNSIILVNADEIHSGCAASAGGWAYRAMYPLPEQMDAVLSEQPQRLAGTPYFPEPVVQDPALAWQLDMLIRTLETSTNRLQRESMVYTLLAQLVLRHARSRGDPAPVVLAPPRLQLAKAFLDEHPAADTSLTELSALAGLSPYHLVRQFKQYFGLPPHAYQIQARLRFAKTLIRQRKSLAAAAVEAGFHDQSHMHRHFKKALGTTPGQYALQHRQRRLSA